MGLSDNALIFNLHAKEAEVAILATLLSFEDCISNVSSLLTSEMFYDVKHQLIYKAIIDIDKKNVPIDIISISEELKSMGLLERAGNYAYLSQITNHAGLFSRLTYYACVVVEKFVQRELVNLGDRTKTIAMDNAIDVSNKIAKVSAELDRITGIMTSNCRMCHIEKPVSDAISAAMLREQALKSGKPIGISTGLRELDALIFGLSKGELIVLAGRPGSGKTSVMLRFAEAAAMSGKSVCIYSLEMTSVSLADRFILSKSGISSYSYRTGNLTREDYDKIDVAQKEINKLPIYVDDRSAVSMQYIKGHSRRMYKRGQCDVVMIDYLQLTGKENQAKSYNREQEIAQASAQAKSLAKELGVPVVLLAQLNRDCEKRTDKKPELSDLRESGAIEQDADKVILVYRPEHYGLKTMDGIPIKNAGKLIVAKHRNGSVGEVKFSYNESLTRITDYLDGKLPF